jgi:curved DNA-binding protein CbpA
LGTAGLEAVWLMSAKQAAHRFPSPSDPNIIALMKTNLNLVHLQPAAQEKKLSTAQKRFNSLSQAIDQQKHLLLEWNDTLAVYQQKVAQDYQPLVETLSKHQVEWLHLLDRFYEQPQFKKNDKLKIKQLILNVCGGLSSEMKTGKAKDLFDKYSDEDFSDRSEKEKAAARDLMKDFARNRFNVEVEDDSDISSPEKFKAYLEEKLRQQQAAQEPLEKSAKQVAKEARQQQEAILASKSVQEVYRKLVAVLHPDREPDATERERKTALMQRVNIAYGKKDLLQLLALQLEIEQINASQLGQLANSRLKHFNKILNDQLAEVNQEIFHIEEMLKFRFNLPAHATLSPKQVLLYLAENRRHIKTQIANLKSNLKYFSNSATFDAWLKTYKIPKKTHQDDDFFF